MKKLFTLICSVTAASLLFVANASAQTLHRAPTAAPLAIGQQQSETIMPGENQVWWGYLPVDAQLYGLGVNALDTYHCAIFVPGDHAVAAGKSIQAVRLSIPTSNVKNVKVWVASSLPSAINSESVIQYVDVPASSLGSDYTDVKLANACAIPADGLYVGYTFTVTRLLSQADTYPVATGGDDTPYGLILRAEKKMSKWTNCYGAGYGSLYLQLLLEGQFSANAVVVNAASDTYSKAGASAMTTVSLMNVGTQPLADFTYTIEAGGNTLFEQQVTLEKELAFNASAIVDLAVPAEATQVRQVKTLAITKVNGVANASADNSATFTHYSVVKEIERNVAVEEYTGTGCGWCPRGLVGMERLRRTFGDRFVGIGVHQYNNSDAMFIGYDDYANVGFSSAPSCVLDRGEIVDPYFGFDEDICDDFRAALARPAVASVKVSGQYNADRTQVVANAEIETLFDDSQFSLEFVLVADGLSGTTSAWTQANYYYQLTTEQAYADEYLADFCSGGKNGSQYVTDWKFNDVAIASSYVKGINQVADVTLAKSGKTTSQYTLTLPTKATLQSALDYSQIYVVALLVAPDGTIANASKALVSEPAPAFPLQFALSDGTIVADGTTLTLNEVEDDGFGGIQVPSHLYVKNVSGETVQGGGAYKIETLANGTLQTCFPVNCVQNHRTGTYNTGSAAFAPGELKDMQTEWLPESDGTCVVVYQLVTFEQNPITQKWVEAELGPKVTLKFSYGTNAIGQTTPSAKAVREVTYYDIQGRSIGQPAHGIFLRKTSFADGTSLTQKVLVR